MAAFFMEDFTKIIKISFRSKDDVDTNAFARAHFNGGGHINASGGKYLKISTKRLKILKEKIEEEEFLNNLPRIYEDFL
jgi:phosphoesterase RecJ-like protein